MRPDARRPTAYPNPSHLPPVAPAPHQRPRAELERPIVDRRFERQWQPPGPTAAALRDEPTARARARGSNDLEAGTDSRGHGPVAVEYRPADRTAPPAAGFGCKP